MSDSQARRRRGIFEKKGFDVKANALNADVKKGVKNILVIFHHEILLADVWPLRMTYGKKG